MEVEPLRSEQEAGKKKIFLTVAEFDCVHKELFIALVYIKIRDKRELSKTKLSWTHNQNSVSLLN